MEALNLLKFWRNAGSDVIHNVNSDCKKSDDVETDDDDSFFELVFESSKDVFRNKKVCSIDTNVSSKPQSPIALLKSAPKFRVFMLGFKKSKLEKTETNGDLTATPKQKQFQNKKCSENRRSKRFAVKCKVEEVPVVSLFSRDNSLRSKLQRESLNEFSIEKASSKRFERDDLPKYLKLIKPLYERASRRYGEKTRFSDQFSTVSPMSSPATALLSSPRKLSLSSPRKASEEKAVNRAAGLKVVYKHLGKSRSASSAVGIMPSPVNRRDDSLLQQHDGIQSAILHCKRSYNSSANEFSTLWRCGSDPSHEKSVNQPRDSTGELKRCSI